MDVNPAAGRGDPLAWFGGTPRKEQTEVLLAAREAWARSDVLIVRAPVGAGKSWIAMALARWAGGGSIITPTNNLVGQYLDTWPSLVECPRGEGSREQAREWMRQSPVRVLNYYQYLAFKAYSEMVVFDEAHRLVPTLQELEACKFWDHEHPLPTWARSTTDLLVWAQSHPGDKKMVKLAKSLLKHPDTYQIEVGPDMWRGKERQSLRLTPLTPRHNRPFLWPPARVKKLVFMSATFHEEDLWDLGLESRRVTVLDCASPIPTKNRPVVYDPVGSLGRAGREQARPLLEGRIQALAAFHAGERGVIHTTYELARELRAGPLGRDPRFVWHAADNAGRVLREWLSTTADDRVLVACGMTEGIDLHGDRARWQVVTKIMYPSLADPAVNAKARLRPDWYSWVAARDVQQATGRVARGPTDWGVTYILDSDFGSLYSKHKDMFVPSFRAALEVR